MAAARRHLATCGASKLQGGFRLFRFPADTRVSGSWLLRGTKLQFLVFASCKLGSGFLNPSYRRASGYWVLHGANLQYLQCEGFEVALVYF